MPKVQWLTIPVDRRGEAKLTVTRSGELYGCQLTLFVKYQGAGAAELIPDSSGITNTDFMISPNVRVIPAEKLKAAESVFIDVIVMIAAPAALTGKIDFTAKLEMPDQSPSKTSTSVKLVAGGVADVAHLGWEIDAS